MNNEIRSVDEDQHRRSFVIIFAASPTPVSLRNASTSLTDIYVKEKENKTILRARFAWSFAKVAIFVICTAAVIYQTVKFYKRFEAFHTRININKTFLIGQDFTLPAATVCYESFSRTKFCETYPWYCQEPEDKAVFCENHPHFCSVNTADVLMPMFGDDEASFESMEFETLLYNDSYYLPFIFRNQGSALKSTFIQAGTGRYAKCYSLNLHLYDNEEASSYASSEFERYRFVLLLNLGEKFHDPLEEPKVFFALHSPYEPFWPPYEGEIFEPGYHYIVQMERVEEDYLLPPPYETRCFDYMEEWQKNNKTGPRSQKICREMCLSKYCEKLVGCETDYLMIEDLRNRCRRLDFFKCWEDDGNEIMTNTIKSETWSCVTKCRSECETEIPLQGRENSEEDEKHKKGNGTYSLSSELTIFALLAGYFNHWAGGKRRVEVSGGYEYFEDIDISVPFVGAEMFQLTHSPLYTVEDAFSYIGGLMGCWLGISVWSFTSFFQRCFKRTFQWRRKFVAQRNEHNL